MATHRVTRKSCGEEFTTVLQAICGGVPEGTFQIVADGKLVGFVLPSGQEVGPFDLGNVVFARCDDSPAHQITLERYQVPDWVHDDGCAASVEKMDD